MKDFDKKWFELARDEARRGIHLGEVPDVPWSIRDISVLGWMCIVFAVFVAIGTITS